ncbi:hypothetical protein PF004_g7638 [Phytophthora fragariae]|uniref:Uncharacterized protein n=1 Tax=Phytophthora fragariae TaxID=53985 RepID=A0A6G0P911_9STRA|nr:hypothetical protein PF004_g7638 [Phytophthora fragariae]
MPPSYFYLRPSAFNLVGFAYGKTEGGSTRGGKVKVKLVHSGRWVDEEAQTAEWDQDELTPRAVSGEEAEDGAGTFVGSAICTSTVRPGGGRVWDYGLVVGYHWKAGQSRGWLDVNFDGTVVSIMYDSASTQDVAVEVYALRPCLGQSTSHLMAAEVKAKHEKKLYNRFIGINITATRDSKVLLNAVGAKAVDESKIIPLLDITSFEVTEVTIRHILDFVYYKEGGRTPPTGMSFGDTIFDQMVPEAVIEARPTVQESELALSDGLSDSEDEHPSALTPELPDSQQYKSIAIGSRGRSVDITPARWYLFGNFTSVATWYG